MRAVIGQTYMITQDEELWQKDMSGAVESLLSQSKDPLADRGDRSQRSDSAKPRDRTKVVTYRSVSLVAILVFGLALKFILKQKKAINVNQF